MSETIVRQWEMLRLIPRAPRKIATADIEAHLRDEGFDVNRRTVQRDLQYLISTFPLTVDDRHKPYGWSWMKEANPFDIPGLDLHASLAFRMASDHLEPLLPAATREHLQPHFDLARERLDQMQASGLRSWPGKVRVIPGGVRREPPIVQPEVIEAVQTGLFEERLLDVKYRRRGETEDRQYEVHPLGLVYRDVVGYLVCTLWDYDDAMQLALHRFQEVIVTETPAPIPKDFSLDGYVRSEAFGYLLGDRDLKLRAIFDPAVAPSLTEVPVSKDQKVTEQKDGRLLLVASVRDTTALRAWLLGHGSLVEVLKPKSLRDEIRAEVKKLSSCYGI